MAGTINTIKQHLKEFLEKPENKTKTGLLSIKADISPQDMVDAMKKEIPTFPAVIINYAGRQPQRQGSSLITTPTFALSVGDRNVSGAYVSGSRAIDVVESLVELLDGVRISPLQKDAFYFAGDQLIYQDTSYVLYMVQFATLTVHGRR